MRANGNAGPDRADVALAGDAQGLKEQAAAAMVSGWPRQTDGEFGVMPRGFGRRQTDA